MFESVATRILRAVFGGGADISAANPLPVTGGAAWDSGEATGGTDTTLIDTAKDWEINILENDYLDVEIGTVTYTRRILSNTADTLTFSALPVGVVVVATNPYEIKPTAIEAKKTITTLLNEAIIAAATTTRSANCIALNLIDQTPYLALTVKARYALGATQGIRVHVVTSPTNSATGTHTPAAPSLTIMTDAAAHFVADELIGLTIVNVTDGSSGVITDNDETTVTVVALDGGGATDQWNQNDVYSIVGADYDTEDWDVWTPAFAAEGVLRQTKIYQTDPAYLKVLIENLDAGQVTDVSVTAAEGA